MKLSVFCPAFVVVLVLIAAGCSGDKKTKITGKVTYKNEPLKGGSIYMFDNAGASYSCPIQNDGTYLVTDIMPGSYSVTVETESINPDNKGTSPTEVKSGQNAGMVGKNAKMQGEYAKQMGLAGGGPGGGPSREDLLKNYVKIPKKYATKETANLKVEVLSGITTKDIPLTD